MEISVERIAAFTRRAAQSQAALAALSAAITALRPAAAAEEIAKLKKENEILVAKVNAARNALNQAETKNGKVQVALPGAPGYIAPGSKPAPVAASPVAATSDASAAAAQAPASEKKVEKPKKEKTEKPKAAEPEPVEDKPIDISRIDFRVARIVTAERHPKADKLYVEDVETGEEKHRTVVSGLVEHIPIEQMQNRLVVLCMNLKPAKLMGVLSEAMVMCANKDGKVEILEPPAGSVPGDLVEFDGFPRTPDAELNPKKKVFETLQPDLKTNTDKVATYKGIPFFVRGKGFVTAPSMSEAGIK